MIVNIKTQPEYRVPKPHERSLRVVLDPRLGSYDKATVLWVTIDPGSSTGLHQHVSDEVIFVVSGRGHCTIVEGDRERSSEVGEGSVVVAKAGVRHEMKNIGSEVLKLYCVFIPPLPAEGYFGEALKIAIERSRGTPQ
ncbi:MAG: cupin domain-containing protein [Sulfolobales archaeon]|nr:cupin domain-containing protein [Sulfolobales archaeon]MCX8209172.1 cupin domain-containing protein [Sulfolobales archaeon]MDW8010643.1 cupin domain-containing protein [Sulfolobales archaeon]